MIKQNIFSNIRMKQIISLFSNHTHSPCIVSLFFRYAWTWSLILSDVSDDDAGEYTCRVSSSSDDPTLTIIKRFNLTVLSKHISHTSVTRSDQEEQKRMCARASDRYLIRHKQYLFYTSTFVHIRTRDILCNQ